jgi:hypothetical protein
MSPEKERILACAVKQCKKTETQRDVHGSNGEKSTDL